MYFLYTPDSMVELSGEKSSFQTPSLIMFNWCAQNECGVMKSCEHPSNCGSPNSTKSLFPPPGLWVRGRRKGGVVRVGEFALFNNIKAVSKILIPSFKWKHLILLKQMQRNIKIISDNFFIQNSFIWTLWLMNTYNGTFLQVLFAKYYQGPVDFLLALKYANRYTFAINGIKRSWVSKELNSGYKVNV